MTIQTINIGSSANDGTGDQLRTAFDKINDNFGELYTGVDSDAAVTNPVETTRFGNVTGDVTGNVTGDVTIPAPGVPATATATGTTGQISWDASFIYVCVATDTWVRSPLTTW